MKSIKLVAVVLLCLFVWVSPALATVSLSVPKTVKILAVNGEEVKDKSTVVMPDGVNQVAFRIDTELAGKSLLDGKRVVSDVLIAKFSASNQGLTMQLPEVKKQYHLDKFNRDPEVKLLNAQGESIPLVLDKLIKEGFQVLRDYDDELADYNQTDAPAAVRFGETAATALRQNAAVPIPQAPVSAEMTGVPGGDQATAETMLKYWYQQADDETRQRFWQWSKE